MRLAGWLNRCWISVASLDFLGLGLLGRPVLGTASAVVPQPIRAGHDHTLWECDGHAGKLTLSAGPRAVCRWSSCPERSDLVLGA